MEERFYSVRAAMSAQWELLHCGTTGFALVKKCCAITAELLVTTRTAVESLWRIAAGARSHYLKNTPAVIAGPREMKGFFGALSAP